MSNENSQTTDDHYMPASAGRSWKLPAKAPPKTYWVWRDGPGGYWVYDHKYPCFPDGDPKALGEPIVTGTLPAVMRFIESEVK